MPTPMGGYPTTPPTGAYAAQSDLDAVMTVPTNADLLLVRASRQIDRALLTSVYDPADADVIEALRAATVEQVAGMIASGDLLGLGVPAAGSFTIGKLSVQRSAGTSAARTGRLYDEAWTILQLAGLTGHEPWAAG